MNNGAYFRAFINNRLIIVCVDSGASYTTINEKFLCNEPRYACDVKMTNASGQDDVMKAFTHVLLRITNEFCLELQTLVAPDSPGSPDLLFGRDNLQRLGVIISVTDALVDIAGNVLPLHPSVRECGEKDAVVVPPLALKSVTPVSLAPKEIKVLTVEVEGEVHGRHYRPNASSPHLSILSFDFDLMPWRVDRPGQPTPCRVDTTLQNTGTKTIEIDANENVGTLTPIVSSAVPRPRDKAVPTRLYSHIDLYPMDGHLLYRSSADDDPLPDISRLYIDGNDVVDNPAADPASAPDALSKLLDSDSEIIDSAVRPHHVDYGKPPGYAFPFPDPFQSDQTYHSGCCLVPRLLSEAEMLEWKDSVADRRAHWDQDDCATLLSHFKLPNLLSEIHREFADLVREFSPIFGRDLNDLRTGMTAFMVHLELKDPEKVMYSPSRNMNLLLSKATARYMKILVKAKIAEHSLSPHAANTFCVPKKEKLPETLEELDQMDDATFLATFRVVQAFCKLNQNLCPSNHSVASLRENILTCRPNMIYSNLDLLQSFFQLVVEPLSRDLLSFHAPGTAATLRLTRPAMGMSASSNMLAAYIYRIRIMEELEALKTYHDDANVVSEGWDIDEKSLDDLEGKLLPGHTVIPNANYGLNPLTACRRHLKHLRKVFHACLKHNVILNPRKCTFFNRVINILGFQLSPYGISVPDKVRDSILKLRAPTSRTELRSLLGLSNVISGFTPSYQDIVGALYELTSSRKTFNWSNKHQEAFEKLKEELHHLPLLAFFHYQDSRRLILYTDASDTAAAGVLILELNDGSRLPLSYCSYKFPSSSLGQSIFRKEYYALAAGLRKNEDILRCCHFTIFLDSKALYFAVSSFRVKLVEQLYRINNFIHSFSFSPRWIPSKSNVSDILTRQVTDDLPPMDLSFLAEFQKDITVMGWTDDSSSLPPLGSFIGNAFDDRFFLDAIPSSDPTRFFQEVLPPPLEKVAGPPADAPDQSARTASAPDDEPVGVLPLDDGATAEDLVRRHCSDAPFNFPAHSQPTVPSGDPDPNLPFPAMLRVFSHAEFLEGTEKDTELNLFTQILTHMQPEPDPSLLQCTSKSFRIFFAQKELYVVRHRLLYRKVVKENSSHLCLVVPQSLRSPLVARIHVRFGHPGIASTLLTLRRAYFFPHMDCTVRQLVLNCKPCLQYKDKTDKTFVGDKLDGECTRPWETAALDHFTVGHAPHLRSPFSAVLLCVDVFSGFVVVENVKSTGADDTVSALKRIFEHYGVPQTVRSDNATGFKNKQVQSFLRSFGVNHVFSIPYTPTSNGVAERYVGSLKTKLRLLLASAETKTWHQFTKTAAFALNSCIRPTIGYSPQEKFFGTPPYIDGSMIYATPSTFRGNVADYMAQREKFFDVINNARWGLVDRSTPRSLPPSYEPGQQCFIRNFTLSLSPDKQLQQKFLGPYTVAKRLNAYAYMVDRNGLGHTTVHVNNIRPFCPDLAPSDPASNDRLSPDVDPSYPMELISDRRLGDNLFDQSPLATARNPPANSDSLPPGSSNVAPSDPLPPNRSRNLRPRVSANLPALNTGTRPKRARSATSSSDSEKLSKKIQRRV